jgi:hypothetical protein
MSDWATLAAAYAADGISTSYADNGINPYRVAEDDVEQDEEREEKPERKPTCSFVKRQTLLVVKAGGRIQEFPTTGDEKHTGSEFVYFGPRGTVYGYILNRRAEFKDKFYGWGKDR